MAASVRYVGRASRVRLPDGQVAHRNVPLAINPGLAAALDGDPDYVVTRPPAPPAPLPSAPRSRPTRAALEPSPAVVDTAAADPADAGDGADPATVAAPALEPVAAEGEEQGA